MSQIDGILGKSMRGLPVVGVLLLTWTTSPAKADNEIFAVQSRASTPNFQLFLNLADDSTVTTSGPLYGPTGGVYGLTYLDDTIYAAELDSGGSDEYLATIPRDAGSFGQGIRVGGNPIGFPNVESLAAADGVLYGTSIEYTAHRTTLITIDPVSGIGSAVGTGDFDVIIVGLAFNPLTDVLYGAGIPFGSTGIDTPNLYTLDRTTGDTMLVGDMGVELQSLAWDAELGLIGAFDRLYDVDTSSGVASQIGSTDFTDGIPGSFNGIFSLAAVVADTSLSGDFDGDGDVDGEDFLLWQRGGSPNPLSASDLTDWEANYAAAVPVSISSTAVPEPTICTGILVITMGLLIRRPH